jgi:hypothetical protein
MKFDFYSPQMEYEESIGFVTKNMKKIITDFHVLGLLMTQKHDLTGKNFSVCHAPLPLPLNAKFVPHLQPRP